MENETPQLTIENTPTNRQIENDEGVIYDVELENTKKNLRDNTGFFKTYDDPEHGWMFINYPIKLLVGTGVQINDLQNKITAGIQKFFTNSTYNTIKSMNVNGKRVFKDILQKTVCYNRIPPKGRISGRDRYIKTNLGIEVGRISSV